MQQYNGSVLALKLMEQGWKVEVSPTNSLRWSKEIEGKLIEGYSSSLAEPPELVIKAQEQLDRKFTGESLFKAYCKGCQSKGVYPTGWNTLSDWGQIGWNEVSNQVNTEIERQVAERVAALIAPTEVSDEKPTDGEVDKEAQKLYKQFVKTMRFHNSNFPDCIWVNLSISKKYAWRAVAMLSLQGRRKAESTSLPISEFRLDLANVGMNLYDTYKAAYLNGSAKTLVEWERLSGDSRRGWCAVAEKFKRLGQEVIKAEWYYHYKSLSRRNG